jgi:sulfonate transport system ATP-binding protein
MIFQESRLFPWLKIADNIAFGISKKNKKNLSKKEQAELVQKYLELVNLAGFENAYPHQLSGGMQQRISIARALIENPDILLLDEPFGALDALTRINMQNEVLHIWEKEKKTMILVTHDIDEAIFLSDRIVVMSNRPGHIKKIINVDMSRPRDRSSFDFIKIRTEIFKIFFAESSLEIEYYI